MSHKRTVAAQIRLKSMSLMLVSFFFFFKNLIYLRDRIKEMACFLPERHINAGNICQFRIPSDLKGKDFEISLLSHLLRTSLKNVLTS